MSQLHLQRFRGCCNSPAPNTPVTLRSHPQAKCCLFLTASVSRAQRRRRLSVRSEGRLPSDGTVKGSSRQDLLTRIRKAKDYKVDKAEQSNSDPVSQQLPPAPPSQPTPAVASALPLQGADVDANISAYNWQAASPQEQELQAALANASPSNPTNSASAAGSDALQANSVTSSPQSHSKASFTSQLQATGTSKKEQLLARIAKAKEYQQPSEEASKAAAATSSAQLGTRRDSSGATGGTGSAEAPAAFLQTLQRGDGATISPDLSPEQFTLQREKQMREQGAELITIDTQQRRDGGGGGGQYQPKVATWGVFPRPENISRSFGGGRNLRPGQALEDEQDAAARKARLTQAMEKYRKDMGLVVDPEKESASQAAYNVGAELFAAGDLKAALVQFEESAALMAARTRLGGEARLQRALCLDSLGRSQEAFPIYKSIATHGSPHIAKRARQMIFGLEAMDSLKTHTISYGPSKGAYEKYFTAVRSDWDNMYYAGSNSEREDLTMPTVLATAVMVAPLLLVGVKVFLK